MFIICCERQEQQKQKELNGSLKESAQPCGYCWRTAPPNWPTQNHHRQGKIYRKNTTAGPVAFAQ